MHTYRRRNGGFEVGVWLTNYYDDGQPSLDWQGIRVFRGELMAVRFASYLNGGEVFYDFAGMSEPA